MRLLCVRKGLDKILPKYGFQYNAFSAKGPCYYKKGLNIIWYNHDKFSGYIVQIYGSDMNLVSEDTMNTIYLLKKHRIIYWKEIK